MSKIKLTLNSDGSENKRELVDEVIVGDRESIQIQINQLTMQKDYMQGKAIEFQKQIDELVLKLNFFNDVPAETVTLPEPEPVQEVKPTEPPVEVPPVNP